MAGIFVDGARNNAGCRINRQPKRQSTHAEAQRIAINIGEVTSGWEGYGVCINIRARGKWRCHWRIIYRGNAHRDSRDRSAAIAIADRVSDCVGAVEIGFWGVGNRAIGVDYDSAVGRARLCNAQRIGVGITVIGENGYGDSRIFAGARAIIECSRPRVGDCPQERPVGAQPTRISCDDDDAINAAIDLARALINNASDGASDWVDRKSGRQASRAEGQRVTIAITE